MKILVTGANGYLGQGVVKQLLDFGHSVVAADFSTENVDERAISVKCDIFDLLDPYDSLEKPDILLHMAWRNGFVHNDASHLLDLPKHYRFIERMVLGGVKQIAVLGTMHEVGFYEGSIGEDTATWPLSMYGIAKDALRNAVKLICNEHQVVYQWIRAYYIVGNSSFGSSIFSKITAAEMKGDKTFPFTLGQNQWDFIDYSDFCKQINAIVSQDEVTGIINACSGRPEKLADRVERFIKENHYSIKLEYGVFPDRKYDSKAVWGNNDKILKILEA
ncbi:NAD-dependent epimerase/dehydratase family protein [Streptococcus massiliensis]|uniref:CpsJ n=1 Tax=Streptococcus massiliensis TaxID=313439 RepID=A0A380KYW3_9STRE|nr:NAD(P)-dependent oxidoreductase [Streptococcus massiliensis]SUN76469.1 CpsJ [Streptococcus massiliensis]